MLDSVRLLLDMGYKLYGSMGTSDYYNEHGLYVETIDWMFGNAGGDNNQVIIVYLNQNSSFQNFICGFIIYIIYFEFMILFNLKEESDIASQMVTMSNYLSNKMFDLVINLPMRIGGARRVSSFGLPTNGYRARRMAIDFSVPLITDIKCAKMIIVALYK